MLKNDLRPWLITDLPYSTVTVPTSTRIATVNNIVSVTVTSTTTVSPPSLAARAPEPTDAAKINKRAAHAELIREFIRQVQESSSFDSTQTALQSISSGLATACDCLGWPTPSTTTETLSAPASVRTAKNSLHLFTDRIKGDLHGSGFCKNYDNFKQQHYFQRDCDRDIWCKQLQLRIGNGYQLSC